MLDLGEKGCCTCLDVRSPTCEGSLTAPPSGCARPTVHEVDRCRYLEPLWPPGNSYTDIRYIVSLILGDLITGSALRCLRQRVRWFANGVLTSTQFGIVRIVSHTMTIS